jgi:dipeptidyl aminopeptidase/acylaminoacyl peptidase
MYGYMLDRANLAELLHLDTKTKFPYSSAENDKWRIAKSIKAHGLPPTYVVHGDIDRAVGVEQADEVVGVMVGRGLEVEYDRLDVDHLFDAFDSKVELEGLYEYMHAHL